MASKRIRDTVGIDPDRVVSAALEAALGETSSRRKKHHPGRVLAAGAAIAAAAAVGQKRVPRLVRVPLRMGLHRLGDMAHVDDLADAVRDRLVGHDDEPDYDDYDDEDLDDEDLDDEDLDDEDFDDEDFDDEPRGEAEDESDEDEGLDDDDEEDGGPEDGPDDDGPRGDGDEADDEELEDEEPEEDLEAEPDDDEPDGDEPEDEELPDEEPDEEEEDIAARSVDLGVQRESNGRGARARVPDLFEALRTPHRRPPVMRATSLRVDPARRPPQPDHDDAADESGSNGSSPRRSTNGRSEPKSRGRSKNQKSTAARS